MKTIIIVSYDKDGHATHLLEKAHLRNINAVLFDAGAFPFGSEVSLNFFNNQKEEIKLSSENVAIHDIAGVWWRRPKGAKLDKLPDNMEKYINRESEILIRSLRDFLPTVNWISDPEANSLAGRKPVQLMVAKRIGFKIPETCISNSPDAVKKFIEYLGEKKLTMKPVGSAFIELATERKDSQKNQVVFTKIVNPNDILENIDMVRNCPVIFQEAIQKDFDIRVTVVDNNVFAAGVHIDGGTDEGNLDWRNYAGTRRYEKHKLPADIEKLCVEFVKEMGLRFGCIDLGFSHKDGYTFFEINPQGQWLPYEIQLGYPISDALLDSLIG